MDLVAPGAKARPGILRLRLRNFKSYPGQVDIELSPDATGSSFVSVVGLNGSGKSNMLDAVAFAIGMQPSELRCNSIEELVHSTADSDEAQVEAVLVDQVFRRSTRGKFWLGAREVAHDEYLREWQKLNVSRHCIMQQGEIERVASLAPEALATMVESLNPDVTELVEEYTTLSSQLQQQMQQTRSSHMQRRHAQADVRHYSELSAARERYEQVRDQLHELEERREHLKAQLEATRRRQTAARRSRREKELMQAQQEVVAATESENQLQREFAREKRKALAARQAEQRAAAELSEVELQAHPLMARVEAIEQELRLLDPELDGAQEELVSLTTERDRLDRRLHSLGATSPTDGSLNEGGGFLPRIVEAATDWSVLVSGDRDKLGGAIRREEIARQQWQAAKSRDDEIKTRCGILSQTIAEHKRKAHSLDVNINESKEGLESSREELETIEAEQVKVQHGIGAFRDKLREVTSQLKRSDGSRRSEQRRAKVLDAVSRLRREFGNGVLDVLGGLVSARDESNQVALDRVLSVHVESVVVDSTETAVACIERLRNDQLNLTFLPLSQLDTRTPVRPMNGNLLIDAVDCAPRIRPALIFALGDTLIADSMDQALQLRRSGFNGAVVLRDGMLLSASGLMSGGYSTSSLKERTAAGLQRQAHSTVDKLRSAIEQERELREAEEAAASRVSRFHKIIASQLRLLEEEQARVSSLQREHDHIFSTSEPAARLEELQSKHQSALVIVTQHKEALSRSERQYFTPIAESVGLDIDDLLRRVNELLGDSDANGGAKNEFARQRERISSEIEYVTDRVEVAQNRVAELKARRSALTEALDRAQIDLQGKNDAISLVQARLTRFQERAAALRSSTEDRSDSMHEAEAATQTAKTAAETAEAQVAALVNDDGSISDDDVDDDVESAATRTESDLNVLDDKLRSMRNELADLVVVRGIDDERERASQQFASVSEEAQTQRVATAATRHRLDEIAEVRTSRFNATLRELQIALSEVYSDLTGGSGHALLTALNISEPWGSDGLAFTAMPPGSSYIPIGHLSGGERSVAALALLLAIQRIRPAPFVILDEVDAALDSANVQFVGRFLRSNCQTTQFLAVSLKPRLYRQASQLVGIFKGDEGSRVLTLAL